LYSLYTRACQHFGPGPVVTDDFHVKTVNLEGAEQMPAQFSAFTLLIDIVCRLPVLSTVVPLFCTQNYRVCIAGAQQSPWQV
jgi:hypothetical protein